MGYFYPTNVSLQVSPWLAVIPETILTGARNTAMPHSGSENMLVTFWGLVACVVLSPDSWFGGGGSDSTSLSEMSLISMSGSVRLPGDPGRGPFNCVVDPS
jgi:hypothetical protein